MEANKETLKDLAENIERSQLFDFEVAKSMD